MRNSDLFDFGISALRRHKLRTFLTVLGVAIGTATLVISISIGLGVNAAIEEQFRNEVRLRQITVFPNSDGVNDSLEGVPADILQTLGDMSDDKRERIRKLCIQRWKRDNTTLTPKPLTRERVEELSRLPYVVEVIPELDESGRAFFQKQSSDVRLFGVPFDHKQLGHRLDAGRRFSAGDARECLIHEYLLYRWGIRNDDDVRACVGKSIRVELTTTRRTPLSLLRMLDADLNNVSDEEMQVLEKAWKLLPQSLASLPLSDQEKTLLLATINRKSPNTKKQAAKIIREDLTIVGVIRAPMKNDPADDGFLDTPLRDADLILPQKTAEALFLQLPKREENGFSRARVIVDHEDHLEPVVHAIKKMGLNEFSMGLFIQQVKKNASLIGIAMDFIALVALIVAAIGITNTMFTTVLERTREIGILKAIGAKDRQILTIFLIEGSLIGLAGGLLGLLLGWLASFPGNSYALRIMEKQGHHPMPDTVFLYPAWLLICVPMFAMLMTTLAALWPARRAARVEPVIALRHE
ncbi:MAG: ABC transporter permease [Planctomycetes bacterium]|nr:ABC transporter permease [Planctomycetota bacterium]